MSDADVIEMRRIVAQCGPRPEKASSGPTRHMVQGRMVQEERFFQNGVKEALYETAAAVNEKIMYPSLKKYYSHNYEREYTGGGSSEYQCYGGGDPYFDVYAYSACPECDTLISRIQAAEAGQATGGQSTANSTNYVRENWLDEKYWFDKK